MLIPVSLFLALALAVISYSQGNGGPIAGLVFFGVLFLGALIHVSHPMIEKAKPMLPSKSRR